MVPKKIVLVRHGQSQGNVNPQCYVDMDDNAIPLSECGIKQALDCGEILNDVFEEGLKVHTFVSPYARTRQTFEGIRKGLRRETAVHYDARLREQHWGLFANVEEPKNCITAYGNDPLYFKFLRNGESGVEVLDRLGSFIEMLYRYFRGLDGMGRDANVLIVTHGMTMRLFLSAWFDRDPEDVKNMRYGNNCEPIVLVRDTFYDTYSMETNLMLDKDEESDI